MKKISRGLIILLALSLLTQLSACGKAETAQETSEASPLVIETPQVCAETEPGWITTELAVPEGFQNLSGLQRVEDCLYFHAETREGGFAVLRYDTLKGQWKSWILDTGEAKYPYVDAFSAAQGAVWVRLFEGYSYEELATMNLTRRQHYYLIVLDPETGGQTCTRMDFWRNDSTGHDPYFSGMIALDGERAILNDDERVRVISRDAQVTGQVDLPLEGSCANVRIGDRLYVDTRDGWCALDPATLQCGEPLEALFQAKIYNSSRGRFLVTKERMLYEFDPASGAMSPVFPWMDVALEYSTLWSAYEGLENSLGELYYLAGGKLVKVSPGMVPVKKTLTLGCFADASAYGYEFNETAYTCPETLLDAVMRFNQTDPEYRIVIKSMVWHDEAERNRLMVELATSNDIDVLDTSLLLPGAVGKELLVDLLPYIDADPDIRREDFIPGLFAALTEGGGLYEYTDKFTLLTMLGAEHLGINPDQWTVERAIAAMDETESALRLTREEIVLLFSWAATAEFMDRSTASCRFDSPEFMGWLELLKWCASSAAVSGTISDGDCEFLLSYDYAADAGFYPRLLFADEAVVLGFPGSSGTGTYFMKLLPPGGTGRTGELWLGNDLMHTAGCNTSLGIMASSKNRNGAWRFVKTFMRGGDEPYLTEGIPVFRGSFEQAVENSLHRPQSNVSTYESFNERDAAVIRELVYNTDQLVIRDGAVTEVLEKEINAFLSCQKSAGEAAGQIQSRLSLYMAEHYG